MKTLDLPASWRDRALVIRDVVTDFGPWFTPDELEEANAFALPKRREEWMHARVAAKQLALSYGICDDPRVCRIARPSLIVDGTITDWQLSITHSHPYAGAALARSPIGIDVERVRPMKESAAHLFLTDAEESQMQACELPNRLLHFWAAKEAAWKQRGGAVLTLKKVPLTVEQVSETGIVFDAAETIAIDDVVAALTR